MMSIADQRKRLTGEVCLRASKRTRRAEEDAKHVTVDLIFTGLPDDLSTADSQTIFAASPFNVTISRGQLSDDTIKCSGPPVGSGRILAVLAGILSQQKSLHLCYTTDLFGLKKMFSDVSEDVAIIAQPVVKGLMVKCAIFALAQLENQLAGEASGVSFQGLPDLADGLHDMPMRVLLDKYGAFLERWIAAISEAASLSLGHRLKCDLPEELWSMLVRSNSGCLQRVHDVFVEVLAAEDPEIYMPAASGVQQPPRCSLALAQFFGSFLDPRLVPEGTSVGELVQKHARNIGKFLPGPKCSVLINGKALRIGCTADVMVALTYCRLIHLGYGNGCTSVEGCLDWARVHRLGALNPAGLESTVEEMAAYVEWDTEICDWCESPGFLQEARAVGVVLRGWSVLHRVVADLESDDLLALYVLVHLFGVPMRLEMRVNFNSDPPEGYKDYWCSPESCVDWLHASHQDPHGHYGAIVDTLQRVVREVDVTVDPATNGKAHSGILSQWREWTTVLCLEDVVLC